MSDPVPSETHEQTVTQPTRRAPWQELGYEKIAAADAEAGSAPSSSFFDGLSYS